jgi:hypothetical protein
VRHACVNRRFDRQFFTGMAIAMLVFVFIGFARSYFLAGVLHSRPLPNLLVHVHGALFTAWILLLVTQTSLVAGHRVRLHRRLVSGASAWPRRWSWWVS